MLYTSAAATLFKEYKLVPKGNQQESTGMLLSQIVTDTSDWITEISCDRIPGMLKRRDAKNPPLSAFVVFDGEEGGHLRQVALYNKFRYPVS